jgi:4-amino-4-deoxy-L-arabinose transferase-like glycosyltransferase
VPEPVQDPAVSLAQVQTPVYADRRVQYAAGAALCLLFAFLSSYLCLTRSIVIRSANISNSADTLNLREGDPLPLSSGPLIVGGKTVNHGFDGLIWIGSRTVPRINIYTSAALTQVQVDDEPVPASCHALVGGNERLGPLTPKVRCEVDLSGLQRNHFQRLAVALSDTNTPFSLKIEPTALSPAALVLGGAALFAILVSAFLLCRLVHQSWTVSAISALALGVRLIYWLKTPAYVRTHDASGHVQYVALVASNWIRPDRNTGWETHQAPLYYYIGAGVVSLARHFGFNSVEATLASLQGLSLAFSVLTAIVAFLCFRQCGELFCSSATLRERAVAMSLALYVFWPTVVMDSVRIGNDSLLLLLAAIFLLCVLRWHPHQHPHALVAASVAAALAVVTKASGVLLLPVLCLAAGLEWRRQPARGAVCKHLFWIAPMLILAGLVTFGSGIQERISGRDASLLLGKNIPGPEFAVATRPGNYLFFNPGKFVLNPFTDLFNNEYGRQKFWYYFWKTSLFGEFRYADRFEKLCASALSGLLLLLFILALFSILSCSAKRSRPLASMLAFAAAWVGGTIAFSILQPFVTNRDFRYAAPALICICWFAASNTSANVASTRWTWIAKCADMALVLFIGASIGFTVGLPAYP